MLFVAPVCNLLHSYKFGHQITGGLKTPAQLNYEEFLICHYYNLNNNFSPGNVYVVTSGGLHRSIWLFWILYTSIILINNDTTFLL